MRDTPLRLAIIVASTREGRFGPTVARWFAEEAGRHDDMDIDTIDLAQARIPTTLTDAPTEEVTSLAPRLEAADAFTVVTPEYNHSFPASLKAAIDWYHAEWRAKPIGFVSYGGMAGGLRAVEQLRQVFAELHAVTVRDTVSFAQFWALFDDDGRPHDEESCGMAAKSMLNQLAWWGYALRDARNSHPYPA